MRKMKTGGGRIGAIYTTQGVNTTQAITGGGINIFSPSQEEREDSQEEFQTGSGVIDWLEEAVAVAGPCQTQKAGKMLCLCASANSSHH